MSRPFWETKSLSDMNPQEWESLCDGCARCCMIKLEDEDSREVHYTAAVCHLLDHDTGQCTRYPQRHELVPDCVVLDAKRSLEFHWLPKTCAYRTLAEGRPLQSWHPLISGNRESVIEAGISVLGRVVSEHDVHPEELEDMVVQWVAQS